MPRKYAPHQRHTSVKHMWHTSRAILGRHTSHGQHVERKAECDGRCREILFADTSISPRIASTRSSIFIAMAESSALSPKKKINYLFFLALEFFYSAVKIKIFHCSRKNVRCENRPASRPASRSARRQTGLEMPGIPVQTSYGWKSLKVCLIDSNFRSLPRTRDPPSTWGFSVFEKVVFSKGTCREKQDGKEGGQDRVERGQEVGENLSCHVSPDVS